MAGRVISKVFLVRVAVKVALQHAGSKLLGDLNGAVARARIEHDDFVAPAQRVERARQVLFFVQRNERGGDLHDDSDPAPECSKQ